MDRSVPQGFAYLNQFVNQMLESAGGDSTEGYSVEHHSRDESTTIHRTAYRGRTESGTRKGLGLIRTGEFHEVDEAHHRIVMRGHDRIDPIRQRPRGEGLSCTRSCVYSKRVLSGTIPLEELKKAIGNSFEFNHDTTMIKLYDEKWPLFECFNYTITGGSGTERVPLHGGEQPLVFQWDGRTGSHPDHGLIMTGRPLEKEEYVQISDSAKVRLNKPKPLDADKFISCGEGSWGVQIPSEVVNHVREGWGSFSDFKKSMHDEKAKRCAGALLEIFKASSVEGCHHAAQLFSKVCRAKSLEELDVEDIESIITVISANLDDVFGDSDVHAWYTDLRPNLQGLLESRKQASLVV